MFKICVLGQGRNLPIDGTVESNSLSMTLSGEPDNISVVCDKSYYQVDFPLEAVGLELKAASSRSTN